MRNSPVLGSSTLLRRTSALAAVSLVAVLALAGCGDDPTPVAEDPAAETTSAAPTTTAPAEPTETPTTSAPADPPTPDADTLITLDKPADGATVSGSFDASGTANSPEANVPWAILDGTGKKVAHGHFTAEGWMDKLYPYAGQVDVSSLAPGSYTFEVRVDDTSDGEGKPAQKVSRSITVQ